MNNQLNVHYRPNFQANYIIKGSAREIGEFNALLKQCLKYKYVFSRNLVPEYEKDQPYLETLYATGFDRFHLRDYSLKKIREACAPALEILEQVDCPSSGKVVPHELMHKVRTIAKKTGPTSEEYAKAVKDGGDAFADFMIDLYQKARMELVEILGKDKAASVKIFDVKDVLKAVKEKKFDFINGKINEQ